MPTEFKIDNNVSRDFTIVEVITEDRPGVLYAIARALYVAGLDIHRSKIATEANRAIDVFYVRDKATMDKITTPNGRPTCATRCSRCSRAANRPKLTGSRVGRMPMTTIAADVGAAVAGRGRRGRAAAGEGREAVSQGDVAGALAAFDEAAKVDPKDARPHYLKGVALEKKGDNAGADRRLQAGDRAQGRLPRGAQQPGRAAARAQRPTGAAGEFEAR